MSENIIGQEFRISKAARSKIFDLLQSSEKEIEKNKFVPVITWISEISDRDEFIPGPHLGLTEIDKIPNDYPYYYEFDSIRAYIMLDEKRVSECKSKVLDYRCNRFFLIYEDEF